MHALLAEAWNDKNYLENVLGIKPFLWGEAKNIRLDAICFLPGCQEWAEDRWVDFEVSLSSGTVEYGQESGASHLTVGFRSNVSVPAEVNIRYLFEDSEAKKFLWENRSILPPPYSLKQKKILISV
ncbi:hypothetical protein [Neosynechococcus sphagnicola]|uniref:hypothetical protein n=1 Tax=Neosynechococcus sphagnicola TaxID=1501145 RepID=UPI0019554475|nr:hypothetical protein [Neosynechococcus sphagnicola]